MRAFVCFFILLSAMVAIDRRLTAQPYAGRAVTAAPSTAPTVKPSNRPWPVQYKEIVRENPAQRIHVITVDMTDPRVRIRVCPAGDDPDGKGPWQVPIRPVREIAEANGLAAAVNANYFAVKEQMTIAGVKVPYYKDNWAVAQGWAVCDGKIRGALAAHMKSMIVDRDGHILFRVFDPILPASTLQAVAGSEFVVQKGKNAATNKERVPRTMIGVNENRTKLIMLVCDGRRPGYAEGLTSADAADIMIESGAFDALHLDGGGSSTMVMRDPADNVMHLKNRPSDGHDLPIALSIERPVAYCIGVDVTDRD